MNIIALENKFKNIERREKVVNTYYNPLTKSGPKHYCIKDLQKDFEYDTQLYGLGKFLTLPSELSPEPIIKLPQPINSESPIPNSQEARIEKYQRLIKSTEKESNSTRDGLPKLKSIEKTKDQSPSKTSKLKDLTILSKYKLTPKNEYYGVFSHTKVSSVNECTREKKALKLTPEWISGSLNIQNPLKNRLGTKTAMEMLEGENECKQDPNIRLFKKTVRDKTQVSPNEYFFDRNYREKQVERFKLDDEDGLRTKRKNSVEKPNWYNIKYHNSPLWKPMVQGTLNLSLISSEDFPCVSWRAKINDTILLTDIAWLKKWQDQTLRVQIKNHEFFEFYLHLGEESEEKRKNIEELIENFLLAQRPAHVKKTSISPVNPLTLKQIAEKSPIRSKSTIRLPLIVEKTPEVVEEKYHNPLTQKLMMYRENSLRFNPTSFPANLTIFEMHDMLEKKYKKPHKDHFEVAYETLKFEIKGNKLTND
ncbi:hypothetical protein SteCoe_34206 [Stentor coeruleus]|uniref:Uncharacterized protein n=1 Tax=Stentor coeruleus TaxID=5963 RepID=A0A1R2AV91_9CILI|nr:hypothetical protein SteCoe_34206 [Stentor coeruleus]